MNTIIRKVRFDLVFPQAKEIRPKTKAETIALAHKVAAALKTERDKLAREQQENITTCQFFPAST